ncbi:MAG: Gfo/Idh/MocA family oxidoreductase [Pseudomonadota bacterium]
MIRVAILGVGIGAQHLEGYRDVADRFMVSTICDLDAERAREIIGSDQDIRIATNIADVMADPDIDLVDVCLPPHLHVPTILQALSVKKHVICEKPIARSLAEVDQIEAAIVQSGCRVIPVFQYRYGMAIAQLQALRDAGLAGRALVASAETHWNRDAHYYAVPWRGTWKGEAGGAVLSHAIHIHDLLCHVLGPVAELSAFTETRVNEIETEDCAAIAMRMQDGALATSSVTLGASKDTTRLRFCFEGLTAESGTAPYKPAEDKWTFTARGATKQEDVDQVLAKVAVPKSGFAGFVEAVANAIQADGKDIVSFKDGRRSIELVTAIYESANSRGCVCLPISKDAPNYHGWLPEQTEE